MNKSVEHYKIHDAMTDIKNMKSMVTDIPSDIPTIVKYVQNVLLHQHWSAHYGIMLSDQQKEEPFIRGIDDKLLFLNVKGFDHVSDHKEHKDKMIGICRDFSVMATALCREAGIPARARCGFADYLEKGKYIDHWVLEYWNKEEHRWAMVDSQLDTLQQDILKLGFSPFDISNQHFLTGPEAWKGCRENLYDPKCFGIFKWWGYDYLRCNLILDANSLAGKPMQPWDYWEGYKSLPIEQWTEKDYAIMDDLVHFSINADTDYESFYDFIETNDKIRVPEDFSLVSNGFL